MIKLVRFSNGEFVLYSLALGEVIQGREEIRGFLAMLSHLGHGTPDAEELFADLDALAAGREGVAEADFDIEVNATPAPLAA